MGQSAGELSVGGLVEVLRGRRATPYLSLGAGIYRAMFQLEGQPGEMMGGSISVADMPMFYGRRMDASRGALAVGGHMQGFTDPVFTLGGGVRVEVSPHVFLRPEIRAVTVIGGDESNTFASILLSMGYRFRSDARRTGSDVPPKGCVAEG